MKDNSRKRHTAKAITWRIVGTIDTMLLAWLVSGNPMIGFKVGISEVLTKLILYYFHEHIIVLNGNFLINHINFLIYFYLTIKYSN